MNIRKTLLSVIAVIVAAILISPAGLQAQAAEHPEKPYQITAYNVNIDVTEDNTLKVTENIDVYFNEERHGIIRIIPTNNRIQRADGSESVTNADVENISCSDEYSISNGENDEVTLQIGDADTFVTGSKHYVISYDYALGMDTADGCDELYFNIIGNDWDTYIDNVTFTITMPKEFDSSLLGFSTGRYGTAGTDSIRYTVNGPRISGMLIKELAPGEAFTVRLELPDGYFYYNRTLYILKLCAMVLLPLICLAVICLVWYRYGRDKKPVITVEFYPPEDMSSADVCYWYTKGKFMNRKLIALLIELANEGCVAIYDAPEESGRWSAADYAIERLKTYDGPDENKRLFFEGLFESGKTTVTDRDLRNRFYVTLNKIQRNYGFLSGDEQKMIYSMSSFKKRLFCRIMIAVCFVIIFFICGTTPDTSAQTVAFITGVVILILSFLLSHYIVQMTEESLEKLGKILGFKKFLETAEKDRLETLAETDPKYFYNILPYAYVLDVSDVWVDKFRDIATEPPEWYYSNGRFDTVIMWASMNSALDTMSSAMTSTPQRSSSHGGGGFSGGGSGGGGGRSW